MRAARFLPRFFATWVLGLAAVTAAGCNDFHYYDIDVTFNTDPATMGFQGNAQGDIQVALMTVTGADSDELLIGPNSMGLPLVNGATRLGIVEFSTFADSGNLTFTLRGYAGTVKDDCKTGEGATTIPATSASTTMGMLKVNFVGAVRPGC